MENLIHKINEAGRALSLRQRRESGGREGRTDESGVAYGTGRGGYESPILSILRFESEPILDTSVTETFTNGLLEEDGDW